MSRAVCLISGGMDSCVTAAIANEENDELFGLHLNYGQRTQKKELECFEHICDWYKITSDKRLIVDVSYLSQIGGSCLTDHNIEVPKEGVQKDKIPISYVPFRNAQILAIAVSWAEKMGANRIYIGAVQEDSSGYPDCREEFYKAFQEAVNTGTKPDTHIEIRTPVIHMSKADIATIGSCKGLKAPLHYTWSCYEDNDNACGECDSCRLRIMGFVRAGFVDPIAAKYRFPINWLNGQKADPNAIVII